MAIRMSDFSPCSLPSQSGVCLVSFENRKLH